MYCNNCGAEIDDNAVVCPNCGVATGKTTVAEPKKKNGLAIAGFVLAFFVPIVGLILSIIGKKKSAELDGAGAKLATAGIVISAIEVALSVVYIILIIAFWGVILGILTGGN